MSESQYSRADSEGRSKRGLRREPGACEPCKYFKTKVGAKRPLTNGHAKPLQCDHQMPCSACRDDTQRYSPCAYSKRAASMQSLDTKIDSQPSIIRPGSQPVQDPVESRIKGSQQSETSSPKDQSQSSNKFFLGLLSIPLVIDKFKYLKSAPGAVQSVISQFDGSETSKSPQRSLDLLEPYESDAGQWGSSTQALVSQNLLIEEFEAIVDLVWTGKVVKAWFQLGNLSRKAYSAYRHFRADSEHVRTDAEKIWNQCLQLEIHLSLMLGEPALSSPRKPQRTEITSKNLWQEDEWLGPTRQLVHKHIQELLALDSTQPSATECFVNAAGAILAHHAFIQCAYCITEEHSIEARDLQMTVHFIFLLLRCCFAEIAQHDLTLNLNALSPATRDQVFHKRRSKLLHCRLALKSAKFVVNIFRQIFDASARKADIWMQCHAVWIASTFLAIGKVRSEIDWIDADEKLQHIEGVFTVLAEDHPDCHLLAPAISKLHDLNAIPQVKSSNPKKRGNTVLEDDTIDSASKRRRKAPVDQISTPGRPAAKSDSEGFSSSSDMMPVGPCAPLSYGDDQNRSVPITPTSILSYNHNPFHQDQWTTMPNKSYSPVYQVPVEQAAPHFPDTGVIPPQTPMGGLSSPIQLFRPGFVPLDPVHYDRMIQPRPEPTDINPTWDGRHYDLNDHRTRPWQISRYVHPEQEPSHVDRADPVYQHHFPPSQTYPHQQYDPNRQPVNVPDHVDHTQTNLK